MQNLGSSTLTRDNKGFILSKEAVTTLDNLEGYVKLEDCLNLKRRTKDQKTGLILEVANHNAFHILGLKDNPNHFDERYADNRSTREACRIDNFLVSETDKTFDIFCFENKNHKDDSNMWSPSWMTEEIFDRAHDDNRLQILIRRAERAGKKVNIHKILVCSHFKGSKQSLLMSETGWQIVELGFQVTLTSFKKAVSILVDKLYWIKNFFSNPNQKLPTSYDESSLPTYSNIGSNYSNIVIKLIDYSINELYSRYINDVNGLMFSGYG